MQPKALFVLLSVLMLSAGCYSESAITSDESTPDGSVVRFYLHDGSVITTAAGKYLRVDNGYHITGKITHGTDTEDYDGLASDSDIKEVTAEKYSRGLTAIGIVFGAIGVFVVVAGVWVVAGPHF